MHKICEFMEEHGEALCKKAMDDIEYALQAENMAGTPEQCLMYNEIFNDAVAALSRVIKIKNAVKMHKIEKMLRKEGFDLERFLDDMPDSSDIKDGIRDLMERMGNAGENGLSMLMSAMQQRGNDSMGNYGGSFGGYHAGGMGRYPAGREVQGMPTPYTSHYGRTGQGVERSASNQSSGESNSQSNSNGGSNRS